MVNANAQYPTEQETIVFVSTQPKEARFDAKCKGVVLKPTAACYIAFDRPANAGDFQISNSDSNIPFLIAPIEFTTISAMGVSGGGSLYIIALR